MLKALHIITLYLKLSPENKKKANAIHMEAVVQWFCNAVPGFDFRRELYACFLLPFSFLYSSVLFVCYSF